MAWGSCFLSSDFFCVYELSCSLIHVSLLFFLSRLFFFHQIYKERFFFLLAFSGTETNVWIVNHPLIYQENRYWVGYHIFQWVLTIPAHPDFVVVLFEVFFRIYGLIRLICVLVCWVSVAELIIWSCLEHDHTFSYPFIYNKILNINNNKSSNASKIENPNYQERFGYIPMPFIHKNPRKVTSCTPG